MEENKIKEIVKRLKKEYPKARVALNFNNPIQILVVTILSAQCTDERVNKVTEKLFKKYKNVKDFAKADIKEFEGEILSTGFYHNKAKNIINSAKIIIDKYKGEIPKTMKDLLTLPGVARKTANIVLGNAYGIVEGIAVDTHVKRLSYRLEMTENTDPEKIEEDLRAIIPKKDWFIISYLLIEHGRKTCDARKPKCDRCILSDICPKKRVK